MARIAWHRLLQPGSDPSDADRDRSLAAEELMKSDAVRKIGFTGSTRVGKMLMSQAAATVKKVSPLCGSSCCCI